MDLLNLIKIIIRKIGRAGRYLVMFVSSQVSKYRNATPRPIFIVCQNRTGSTFLNSLFGAHPQVWTYTEGHTRRQ